MKDGKRIQRLLAGVLLGGVLLGSQTSCAAPLTVEDHGFGGETRAAAPDRAAQANENHEAGTAGVMVLMKKMDRYQKQIQHLQDQIEKLDHEVSTMKQAERERYLDLDTRINALVDQVQGEPQTDSEAGDDGGNAQAPANPEADKKAYVAARGKLLERNFSAAATAFEGYLKDFPQGQFRAHAHFWLGEIYSNQEKPDLAKARKQFQIVVDKYPQHSKAPTSLYKLASLDARAGDTTKAKAELQQLLKQFPSAKEAKLAKSMLEQLQGN